MHTKIVRARENLESWETAQIKAWFMGKPGKLKDFHNLHSYVVKLSIYKYFINKTFLYFGFAIKVQDVLKYGLFT